MLVDSHDIERIIDDDVPQAFSHWTYQYTKGDQLVCDLQGILHNNFFEMTDPAIHSHSGPKYGTTDIGKKGFKDFFSTHKCSPLCKALGLKLGTKK